MTDHENEPFYIRQSGSTPGLEQFLPCILFALSPAGLAIAGVFLGILESRVIIFGLAASGILVSLVLVYYLYSKALAAKQYTGG